MGITDYEPRVVNQLIEYSYRYISTMLDDAKVYAAHAEKDAVDLDDVKLAIKLHEDNKLTTLPPRDLMIQVATAVNEKPLPIPRQEDGLRLPEDKYCLTAPNLRLKSIKQNVIQPLIPSSSLKKAQDTNNNNPKYFQIHPKTELNSTVPVIMNNGFSAYTSNVHNEIYKDASSSSINLPFSEAAANTSNMKMNISDIGTKIQTIPSIQIKPSNSTNGTPIFSLTVDPSLINPSFVNN